MNSALRPIGSVKLLPWAVRLRAMAIRFLAGDMMVVVGATIDYDLNLKITPKRGHVALVYDNVFTPHAAGGVIVVAQGDGNAFLVVDKKGRTQ